MYIYIYISQLWYKNINYKSSGELLSGEIIQKMYTEMSDMVKGLILWKNTL